jgi:hypothetical protein
MDLPLEILAITLSYLDGLELIKVLKSSEEMLLSFRKYSKLIPVNLAWNLINDDDLKYLSGVHTINLSYSDITDEGLQYLKAATDINLTNTRITDNGLKYLESVKSIDLSGCKISDDGLRYLESIGCTHIVCPFGNVRYLRVMK